MRKLITLAMVALALANVPSYGQKNDKDGVMMKDGKMWVRKDDKTMEMTQEMTMKDGTRVMKDGTVMMKDGSKKMISNGQMVDMRGNIRDAEGKKVKDKK